MMLDDWLMEKFWEVYNKLFGLDKPIDTSQFVVYHPPSSEELLGAKHLKEK